MKILVKTLASFFYLGYLPVMPGTFGSAVGLAMAWVAGGSLPYVFLVLSLLGFTISKPAVEIFQSKDPQAFVLDEVCGMMLAVLWIPKTFVTFGIGFLLFRLFDIWKPWPISQIQKNDHPFSILWDDLAAGLGANIVLQILKLVL